MARGILLAMVPAAQQRRTEFGIGLLILSLVGVFLVLSSRGVRDRCVTYDEPLHLTAAWEHYHDGDFRVDVEDPPLWQYWAVIATNDRALSLTHRNPIWRLIGLDYRYAFTWAQGALYGPGNDVDAVLAAVRSRMLVIGVAVALLISCWAWQMGGPWAAALATALFCLDPTFLGHAPLVKNDVVFTLLWCGVAFSLYRVGRAARWPGLVALLLLPGMAISSKFSGLLVFPMVGMCLAIRCLVRQPWPFLYWLLETIRARLIASAILMVCTVVMAWGIIWASYQFRYAPTPDPNVSLLERFFVEKDAERRLFAQSLRLPTTQQIQAAPPAPAVQLALWCNRHRLLPQAFCIGFIYTHTSVYSRVAFLCGQIGHLGWWYYFPAAMLFKTPLATLALGALGIPVIARKLLGKHTDFPTRWAALCLLLPAAFYLAVAMRSHLNIGIRHLLPIYPLLDISAAWGLVQWGQRRPQWLAIGLPLVLVAGLAAEILAACPDYIAYFNVACGGARGGLRLLSDSNLDWGQDLPALATWQRQHSSVPLYLAYFGRGVPEYYGIGYRESHLRDEQPTPTAPGVLAISATLLQEQNYLDENKRPLVAALRQQPPLAVLGGTIYLFPWPIAKPN